MLQAAINIDSLMRRRRPRCCKLHGGSLRLLLTGPSRHRLMANSHDDRDLCLQIPAFDIPIGGAAVGHDVWYKKTRMAWLPDGEKNIALSCTVFELFDVQ